MIRPALFHGLLLGADPTPKPDDFGDSWKHGIEIENVAVPTDPGVDFPTCIAGAQACPPEDCGGASGYQRLLEIMANPEHEEHREMKAWVGRKFHPAKFD